MSKRVENNVAPKVIPDAFQRYFQRYVRTTLFYAHSRGSSDSSSEIVPVRLYRLPVPGPGSTLREA